MPVPIALAAPAAAAGLAYFNARTGFGYDYRLIVPAVTSLIRIARLEKKGRLNPFYILEDYARGTLANKTLLIYEGRSWTYKEVYQMALKYGTWLKTKHGIASKEIVAMNFMNSDKFIFVWFGLWAIGAKPACLNYNLTDKALVHCIKLSTSRLVLVDPEVQDKLTSDVRNELAGVQFEILTPELEGEISSTQEVREPDSARIEDKVQSIGMLIYTSGTTGLPKAAIVSWNKILTALIIIPGWNSFSKNDIFYTSMPLYHSSAAILGFCMVLYSGGTIVIGRKFSTKTFWKEVRSTNATVIQYVGETCRYLLSAPPEIDPVTGQNLDKQNSVRMAFGNGLRPDIWNRFKERFGIDAIAEFYTSTEGAGGLWNLSRNEFGKGAVGRYASIAGLFTSSSVILVELDWETEQPWRDPTTGLCKRVKTGEPGELLFKLTPTDISKRFQGYFNNASSTESKIMRNVLTKDDVYFRTGDMLSRDANGHFFFSDRIGDTYRWKAENVSTSEVAEVLGNHAAIQEANVYGVELPHHDGRAGCVSLVLNEEPSEKLMSDVAKHAQGRLPKFAVPLFLRLTSAGAMQMTGTNKQQKHVARSQGVDPEKTGDDELYWLKGGTYVKFRPQDWEELRGGKVKL